jgi:aspartate racemase
MTQARYSEVVTYLDAAIASLAAAGADFAIISANTPHIVFDELQALSPIPLLSIVEATCQAAKALELHRLGLIGTRFTMKADFYPRVFAKRGIELILPSDDEQDYIHGIYIGELLNGKFLPDTRERLCKIVERMVHDHGIQGAILAGTELPLLLDGVSGVAGVPFLDTTQIHVQAAVEELLR